MTATKFDPLDLTLLAVGWAQGAGHRANALSLDLAEELQDTALMLTLLYDEVSDEWDSAWGYEVAEPLGVWMGAYFLIYSTLPERRHIEIRARGLVHDAMAPSRPTPATHPKRH